jgi:hypothetical protein
VKGGSRGQTLAIQPLLVGGRPPGTDRCGWKMGEGKAGQEDEKEQTDHRRFWLYLFLERWLAVKPTGPGGTRRNNNKKQGP